MGVERLILELDTVAWQLRMGHDEAHSKFEAVTRSVEAVAPELAAAELSARLQAQTACRVPTGSSRMLLEPRRPRRASRTLPDASR